MRNKNKLLATTLGLAMLTGCGGGQETSGETYSFVLNQIEVPVAKKVNGQSQVVGFDLDGIDSGDGSHNLQDACDLRKPDYFSGPPDAVAGVDNQLQTQLSVIETILGGNTTVDEALAEQIASGQFLLIADISNVDDLVNDSSIRIDFSLGELTGQQLQVGADGLLESGQSFTRGQLMASVSGSIVDGRLTAEVPQLRIDVDTEDINLPMIIRQVQLRANISEPGLTQGVIGGAVRVADLVTTVENVAPLFVGLTKLALNGLADMDPSTDNPSVCQALSVGLAFRATTTTQP